jgi:parallel beta-helix repeat protein
LKTTIVGNFTPRAIKYLQKQKNTKEKKMNKHFIHLILIVCLVLLMQPTCLNAKTYIVGDGTYTSIQAAVDDASDGDEIIVKPGEYVENISVGKPLTIRSESGYTSTTVVAKDSSNSVFRITSDNVTIQGFSLYGASYYYNSSAIVLENVARCTIRNNRCGIDVIRQNSSGIYVKDSQDNSIRHNICSANEYYGIYLYYSSNNDIFQNICILNEKYGLYLSSDSNENHIYLNTFIDNQFNSIQSDVFQRNTWHSPAPITYSYNDQLYKSYLGNFYPGHDDSDSNNDGISDTIYNYPYFEPYDEFPLSKMHDNYTVQSQKIRYLGIDNKISSKIDDSILSIDKGRSLIWTAINPSETKITYTDTDSWKGQIYFTSPLKSNVTIKIEIGYSTDQNNFIPEGPAVELMGDDITRKLIFETSCKAFSVDTNQYLAVRFTNLSAYDYDIITGAFTYLIYPSDQNFPPVISTIQPGNGSIKGGTEVTINGSDFGNHQGSGNVRFGDTPVTSIVEWTNSKIVCVAPSHDTDYVTLHIQTDNQLSAIKQKSFLYYDQNIFVGVDEPVQTIQEAIHAASDGLTIVVRKGIYTENIVVNKSLVIKSESGWQSTTVTEELPNAHVFIVIADNTTIQGFTIYGSGDDQAAIKLMADYCTIANNVCGVNESKKNSYGIWLNKQIFSSYYTHHLIIIGNRLCYNSRGIWGREIHSSIIQDNQISLNNDYGVYLYDSDNNIISRNQINENKKSGIYSSDSHNNVLLSNTFQANMYYGIYLSYATNNKIFHNNFIDNQKGNVKSSTDSKNTWFSSAPLYYEYKGKSYKNKIGNYYSDHDVTDTLKSGMTDNYYSLPYYEDLDKYPLSNPVEEYTIDIWHFTDKQFSPNHITFKDDSKVSINKGRSYVWVSSEPVSEDISYEQNTVWSGQLCLSSTPSNNTIFKIDIGVSSNGSDFISYGNFDINASDNSSTIPFICEASPFTIPKNNYMAFRITNLSGNNYEVKVGSFNTFFSKPALSESPDIISIEPENCPTSGDTTITIVGSGFDNSQENQKVMFGDIEALSYVSWTQTQIVCKAPAHTSERVNVWIKQEGQTSPTGTVGQFIFKDKMLFVGNNAMYPTIQSAINASVYSDTIIVKDGTYLENIIVDKPLKIRSENGYTSTTLIPLDSSSRAIQVISDNCLIQGFSIYSCNSYAIYVTGNHCTISNNMIGLNENKTNRVSIYIDGVVGAFVTENICKYSIYGGINLSNISESLITGNICEDNSDSGIYLFNYSKNNRIIGNICHFNDQDGINVASSSSNNLIFQNDCQYNNDDGLNSEGQFNSIRSNICERNSGDGIFISSTSDILLGNICQFNASYGIDSRESLNIMFLNSVTYNEYNAFSNNNTHLWNSPIKIYYAYNNKQYFNFLGNKYSDHYSSDLDNDGIYDEPYLIPDNNSDNYPLYSTPDKYTLQVWTLLPDSRLVNNFSDDVGIIHIEPNDTHVWKAGGNAINLTEHSLWTGQVIFKDAISDAADISVIAGYVNTDEEFIASGAGNVSTVDDLKKRLTFQGIISPATDTETKLAIQIKNNSSSPFDVITGGAWSFFSFGQGNANSPPEVNNDTYYLAPGETFQVDAPGILQNDTDPENDPLSIIIVQNVRNGTLSLSPDGGFTYIHDGGDTTSDTFTYKINDGSMDSFQTATVTLNIIKAPIIQINPQTPISNTAYHVSISSKSDWIEYQINSSEWERYTTPFDIENEGAFTIQARVKSNDDWLDAPPISFTIDQTPPSPPENIISRPPENQCTTTEVFHIEWEPGNDDQTSIAGYSYVLDNEQNTLPDNQIETTTLSVVENNLIPGDHYYFHLSSVDTAGNVSSPIHIGYFCMTQNYLIEASAGLNGRIEPVGNIDVEPNQDQAFLFFPDIGYEIDAVTIDGHKVNVQNNQYVFQDIQANHQIGVSFTKITTIQPPEPINTIKISGGVILEWIDDEILSYNVYRSHSPEGPPILIDPIVLPKSYHDNHLWYQIFDPFNTVDIQKQAAYWYSVSAIMPDGTGSTLSNPVQGKIDIAEEGVFRLIPIQQELEGIAGKNISFEFYVVPVGNFQDSVLLSYTYPDDQIIPNVEHEFTSNNVKPVASSALRLEIDSDAEIGTYQINLNAQGGGRFDHIPLHFSILPPDSEQSFISAHMKQANIRLDERIDIDGHISVRKDEQVDLYGHVIPSEPGIPILISIQNTTTSIAFNLTTLTRSQGDYERSFSFDTTGQYLVYAQYTNQDQRNIQSQAFTLKVRKSIQNKVQCHTENQGIELNQPIKLYTKITPPQPQTPIHFTMIKPESGERSRTYRTDDDGECKFNLDLDEAGIWEVRAYWEGNDQYEGQYSKPLYLYPGVASPHALIIAGGGYQDNPLMETTQYLADRFYKLLIKRRLHEESIMYMSSVVQEKDGRVDKISFTQQTIIDHINGLNTDGEVNEKRPLLIYMVDHGGINKFKLNAENILTAESLNECLNNLQEETECKVQIVIDACYAGSFNTTLSKSYTQNRMIITSTGGNGPSYYDQDGRESFSTYLFNWLSQGFSLGESFTHAETKLREKSYLYYDQQPMISNLQLANETYLGGTFIQGDLVPIITNDHTPNQILTESSLEIYANIIDTEDSQCNVWASILPPNRPAPTYNENSSPQWQLETIQLLPKPEQPDIYAARYNCFYQKGTYVVTVYASDASDNISSKEIFLTVNKEQLPDGWGDIDHDAKISLTDAIMGLKQMSCIPTQSVDQDEPYCTHKVDLAEVLFVLKSLAEGQYTDQ